MTIMVAGMTLQAEQRLFDLKHAVIGRTMGPMADAAILSHRRVLMSEGALLFGMTAVTHFRIGFPAEIAPLIAVDVVAIRTDHLPLCDWMVRREPSLRYLLGVALAAEIRLLLTQHIA
jgi:hypothetical protein